MNPPPDSLYLWDPTGDPDPRIAALERALRSERVEPDANTLLAALPERDPAAAAPRRRPLALPRSPFLRVALAAAAAVALALVGWLFARPALSPAWEIAALTGDVLLDSSSLTGTRAWREGRWVETPEGSRARLTGSGVGRVTVEGGSRLRLLRARAGEHRLELARGEISAFIYAPPRLFFVETPAATAIDMGCAYDLAVDERGDGRLRVTAGWVELQARPVASRVPAGASCRISGASGPGIPVFDDAPPALHAAAEALEQRGTDADALAALLAVARPRDSLTLWHLIPRTRDDARAAVIARLADLAPPADAALAAAATLDPAALDRWWDDLRLAW
ncbi:MAG TPA: FecR domain-containing protein [Phycisphaerales bacterium]|nr:FecR domain-containing protein [Phycisphaerales bacterium]